MDIQRFADNFFAPTCIVSVQRTADGGYGEIRIAAGNRKYIEMIEMRLRGEDYPVAEDAGFDFVPDSLYHKYFPKNRSFEEVCFRAAVKRTPVHTYAHLDHVDIWFDIYAVPLNYEDGDRSYCAYTATPSGNADFILNTISTAQTSNDVLKTCIKLHKANNLRDAMENVISEIRQICKAECCTVLLLNNDGENYSILATDFRENSSIKRVTEFKNFYDIASSWIDMIGSENDCVIIQDKNDMDYYSRVNNPWYLTLVEAGVESVVLFPLRQGHEIIGFIWATNFDTNDTMRIKETLELTTFFVPSHIARNKVLKRLKHMSYTDALTGLPNRFACTEYIADLVSRGEKFAAVSIDINHFKSINDTLGLEAGNYVLIGVAERWRTVYNDESIAVPNYITRINGDEFLLVIWGYESDEELGYIISRYVDALNEPLTIEDCDIYITASFDYAEYPADADSADSLLSHVNAAMNEIKKANSSDHVLRFSSDMLRNEHVLEIENKIRAALENDMVYFNLQPL